MAQVCVIVFVRNKLIVITRVERRRTAALMKFFALTVRVRCASGPAEQHAHAHAHAHIF